MRLTRQALAVLVAGLACGASPAAAITGNGPGSAGASVAPGPAWTLGDNASGQLGSGDFLTRATYGRVIGGLRFTQVAAGESHTLALAPDGTVWSWGDNYYGQLGNSTRQTSTAPVHVTGLTNIVAVAAGASHSLALGADGVVWGWGYNSFGQLASAPMSIVPAPVRSAASGMVAIAAGRQTSLGLARDGVVWAWGTHDFGQLGPLADKGPLGLYPTPVQVGGIPPAVGLAESGFTSYAVAQDRTVYSWGANDFGQLGKGYQGSNEVSPGQATGVTGAEAVAATTYAAAALKADGTIMTWGRDEDGELGTGQPNAALPAAVPGLSGITSIGGSAASMVALRSDGVAFGWGGLFITPFPNPLTALNRGAAAVAGAPDAIHSVVIGAGNLATPATVAFPDVPSVGDSSSPQAVTMTNNGAAALTVSSIDVVGLDADAFTLSGDTCAGAPFEPGATCQVSVRFAPVTTGPAQARLRIRSDALAGTRLLALTGMAAGPDLATGIPGPVWAWGANSSGQLGNHLLTAGLVPQAARTSAVALAAGSRQSYALRPDGTVWAWGSNSSSALGAIVGTSSLSPVRVSALADAVALAGGSTHAVALRADGGVWSWGSGASGQLGNGSTTATATAVPASGITTAVTVAAGTSHSLAVKADGTLWAWGLGTSGQLGDGQGLSRSVPVRAGTLTDIVAAAGGAAHSLALRGDGTVWAWGANASGQLGTGDNTPSPTPVQVPALTGVVAVAAGGTHSVALKADGTVWSWGLGTSGQLGQGVSATSLTPVQASGLTGVNAIAAGVRHTLARTSDGRVWAWGLGTGGQLGNGLGATSKVPVQVAALNRGGGPLASGPAADHSIAVGRPHVALSTAKLVFPAQAPGSPSASKLVTVTDDGAAPLVIAATDIVGGDGDAFKRSGDACAGTTLPINGSCDIGIRFTPLVGGTPVAFLRVFSDSPTSPDQVTLDPPEETPAAAPALAPDASAAASTAETAPAPASAPATPKAATALVACARLHPARRHVTLSCSLAGQPRGRTVAVRLVRGHRIYASGTGRLRSERLGLRLRVRRHVTAGLYTLVVTMSGAGRPRAVAVQRVLVR